MNGLAPVNGKLTRAAIPEIATPLVLMEVVMVADSPAFRVRVGGLIDTSTVPSGTEASLRGSTEDLEASRAIIIPRLVSTTPASVIKIAEGDLSGCTEAVGGIRFLTG